MSLLSSSPHHSRRRLLGLAVPTILVGTLFAGTTQSVQPRQPPTTTAPARVSARAEEPFVVEYYYRVRWGHQAEFLRLFRKNHLPLLEKERQMGLMTDFSAVEPFYHATEDGRWDYRVTIVYPSAAVAHAPDPGADPAFRRALFPDTATFAAEERRRFEILDAHWDVPITPLKLR